ncbi:hypothetical protein FNH22_22010 [Fulvivirga sp. M361]|uniref:hypothetical protein n=1 Tax=Fulvivirga sp. M361 TaxID=2594266 RepID=UPI00117AFEF8|nr:hypothetical protein [Fulvivirga sp. M361]TRX52389.1 hypothetical protein FNH22_22010 [Fulvivirga sp. M361]
MKKKSLIFMSALVLISFSNLFSQQFAVPLEGFSRSKTAYLHMEDGTKFEGLLGGFKRSKGLIETVKMKNPNGKKLKIDPAKISFMYLPPNNLAKFSAAMEQAGNIQNWEKQTTVDTSLMNKGYVYFEKTPTKIKKKTDDLMLQLMNASFSSKIKVYHDPFAKETASIGLAGVDVVGGLDKSYYVKKAGEDAAFRLMKKNYREEFIKVFGDCDELVKKYRSDVKWSDLETHVYEYTQLMK